MITRINKYVTLSALISMFIIIISAVNASAQRRHNAYGQKHYTIESAHFRIHYHRGLDHLIPRVANKLEQLRQIYAETYHITLPQKTDVMLYESEIPDGFAYVNFNFIYIGVHDYEFNLRGSSDWFDDVITHEYAHIVSIQTGLKLPSMIPAMQFGYFTHPNTSARFDGLHLVPSETMPVWFLEGIAQYESSRHGTDSWDTHRDMILRTLTLSGNMLSWPHMQVFAGKGDDYEKTYNHGFSLITYISETYGYEKIVSILRENAKIGRLSFDGSVKAVLGISAHQLYDDWQESLKRKYNAQIRAVGTQVFGRKINKDGYDNMYPRWAPDESKIFFVSNADNDYSIRNLFSYNLSDTIADEKRIRFEMPISGNYDIHEPSGRIAYVSMKSPKSYQPPSLGGQKLFDVHTDTLPPEKPKFFRRSQKKQVTEAQSVFAASFSPDGNLLAAAIRKFDRFFLAIIDTAGNDTRIVYPTVSSTDEFYFSTQLPDGSDSASFSTIFSLRWSPNGKDIAVDYIDGDKRKIGVYDTLSKTFSVMFDDKEHDRRNPSFNKDGSVLYFSSDITGIFNIYRYAFQTGDLEQLTNVSGGAFHPSVSKDESRLVYTGYDRNGYGIYLIDTVKAINTNTLSPNDVIALRENKEPQTFSTPLSNRQTYSRLPRQMLVVPTLVAEQILTKDDNENRGVTHVKGGAVLNFMDPLAWSNAGYEGGAFLLVDLKNIFKFIDLDKGFISPYASYDAGTFLTAKVLPVTVDAELTVRGIAGKSSFYEESEGDTMTEPYKIQLINALLGATHPLGSSGIKGMLFAGYDRYDVAIDMDDSYDLGVFNYNLSYGYRIGAMTWFSAPGRHSRSNISPTGIAGKLQYNLWRQRSLKDESSFSFDDTFMSEQYDDYLFHQFDGRLLFGMPSPIYPKHDFHLKAGGSYLKPTGSNRDIPSFFYPAAQVPGYTFYYKDIYAKVNEFGDETSMIQDTVLVTGQAVLTGQLSYRFPLWTDRGRINGKLGFIYFDMLYGALNLSAGAGFDDPGNITNWNRADWLVSYGAELRLEALAFNNYPLALCFRWDYGADRAKPETFVNNRETTLGGHRFTLSVGFDFDGWGMIPVVDYFNPARWKASPAFRPANNLYTRR